MAGRKCEFTRLAEADLAKIALYIAADSPKTALRFYVEREHAIIIERILHGARHLDWKDS